jgi:DNA-binding XRE family transcriptional regulator
MPAVLLLTDRPEFAAIWGTACRRIGFSVQTLATKDLTNLLSEGIGVVIDGDGDDCEPPVLLARTAMVRVKGAVPVVALSNRERWSAVEDVLLELCGGLVAAHADDIGRMAEALRRRCERPRNARFAYLGTAPGNPGLLAVFADGRVVLHNRPLGVMDDGSEVDRVELNDDGSTARVWLRNGAGLELAAAELAVAQQQTNGGMARDSEMSSDVDGVRLGQRLRALRLAAGLTQAELARRTGIHRPNIARVEAGRHTPSLETLARLAAAIGVSTTRVLTD